MNIRVFFLIPIIILIATSCGGSKKVVNSTPQTPTTRKSVVKKEVVVIGEKADESVKRSTTLSYSDKVQNYIFEYAGIAKQEMSVYGIPASITLAQGILESGAGYGELTGRAKNHFGIKCHNWNGDRVYHDDDRSQECFRKYKKASESFRDHSLFLKNRKRYAKLFTYKPDDYRSWARGLKAAGYATDPKYPVKLIGIIERYGLDKFDRDVLRNSGSFKQSRAREPEVVIAIPQPAIPNNIHNTESDKHIVQKGDTLYSISRKYNVKLEELKAINNLSSNTISVGQILVLTPEENELDEF